MLGRTLLIFVAATGVTAFACTPQRSDGSLGDDQMEDLPYGVVSAPSKPEPFAPQVFSTDKNPYGLHLHSSLYFSPDGTIVLFTNQHRPPKPFRNTTIMQMRRIGNRWTVPEVTPFASEYSEQTGWFSPDGTRFYFGSVRPFHEAEKPHEDLQLWIADKTGDGWNWPKHISSFSELTVDHGPFYIFGSWDGGYGRTDIYSLRFKDGCYSDPENVGSPVNSAAEDYPALVGPDESYLIVYRTDPDNRSITGLYASFRKKDGWTVPTRMDGEMGESFDASLSPDGSVLFFLKRGEGVYWVDASIMDGFDPNDVLESLNGD